MRRIQVHWDVVVNDMRLSRRCYVFKEILNKWINMYQGECVNEGNISFIHKEVVEAGVRFLAREGDKFIFAKATDDYIERAIHQKLKAESQPKTSLDTAQTNALIPLATEAKGSGPHRIDQVHDCPATFPVFPMSTVLYCAPPCNAAPVASSHVGAQVISVSFVPPKKRVRLSQEATNNVNEVAPRSMPYSCTQNYRACTNQPDLEGMVHRLEAKEAVLGIRSERLKDRVLRLETIVMGLGGRAGTIKPTISS
eukprot:scaffold1294_cov167-Amphora_coffeaeformis.AAC.15